MHIALYGSRRANRGLGLVVGCDWAVNNTKMTVTMSFLMNIYVDCHLCLIIPNSKLLANISRFKLCNKTNQNRL